MSNYIVRLYIRNRFFGWKLHDSYAYRAFAKESANTLESKKIEVKLVMVDFPGKEDTIPCYQSNRQKR